MVKIFSGKYINRKERFVIPLYDNKLMLLVHVDSISPIKIGNYQSYGQILVQNGDKDTDIVCKARNTK
jgi:hypothetical protein